MTTVELKDLYERVDRIEGMLEDVKCGFKNVQYYENITQALEKALNNKSRDNKLNILIILMTIAVCLGVFGIFSLYQLAV